MSPVSGLDTETTVAFGNSSKIHTVSPHRRKEWEAENASDGGISGSYDMGTSETATSQVELSSKHGTLFKEAKTTLLRVL